MENKQEDSIMEPDEMTKQKWEVLWYFVQNTADLADFRYDNKCGVKFPTSSGEERFYSYPSRIHKDFTESYHPYGKTSISKVWAKEICEDLCKLGILEFEMIRAPRQSGDTPHYYLKNGYGPYLEIMKHFFEMVTDPRMQRVMMNTYLQNHTDEGLVRHILCKKGAEMRRSIPLVEWDTQEAPKVFEEYFSAKNRNDGVPHCSFAEYVQGEISQSQFPFPPTVSLRLPVFPEGLSVEEQMVAIESLNKETFKRHNWLKQYISGIQEHYEHYEYEHWILPILALIRASPAALNEFLFGDWEPYGLKRDCNCFTRDGGSCMVYPLFTLLFTAVRDLAAVRIVDYDRFVKRVSFRPVNHFFPNESPSALLEVKLKTMRTVYYDGAFDTEHDFYSSGGTDVIELPEETNYSFQSWVAIRVLPGGVLFSSDDFPSALNFLRNLRNINNPTSRYIFERLSHEIQNVIATLSDEELTADSQVGKAILKDLNGILLSNDLYKPEYFRNFQLTDAEKRKPSLDPHSQLNRHLGIVTSEYLNREILEQTFPEIMPKRK